VPRLNAESQWIVSEVPHLRIIEDELWQAVRARHEVIAEKYANLTEAVRKHHKKNLLKVGGDRSRSGRA
jgi:site-specific DNA recombinase